MAIPVDTNKITILAMSGARPAPARAELADGTTRVVPGQQALHKVSGLPVWQIDCVLPADAADEKGRMTTFTAKVATTEKPIVMPGMPVRFVDLMVLAYVDQGSNRAALSWSASGVEPAHAARNEKAA
jgi:hypothetical protein